MTEERRGRIFMGLWAVLIAAGIVAKRVFGHPDLMVFFHLPAALFLVLGFKSLSRKYRQAHAASEKRWRQRVNAANE